MADAGTQVTVTVLAAGSLRLPFTRAAQDFAQRHPGTRFTLVFGAAGLLRERVAAGEYADVFASANLAHPDALGRHGGFGPTVAFARNALCALVRPGLAVTRETLVRTLLDPSVTLGTSTPGADPSGDYAFELFVRVERSGAGPAGCAAALAGKARQLTGGPGAPKPPGGHNVYGMLVASGAADVFLTYRTNARIALAEQAGLQVVDIDPHINVSARYGLVVRDGAPAAAQRFADDLCTGPGQAVLRDAGFLPV